MCVILHIYNYSIKIFDKIDNKERTRFIYIYMAACYDENRGNAEISKFCNDVNTTIDCLFH